MARRASSRAQGLITVSGMIAFMGALSMAPRISIDRNEDSTTIRYKHLKTEPNQAPPTDEGVVLSPEARSTTSRSPGRKPFNDRDWIFDTGATTHVCSNKSLLHRYGRLNPFTNKMHPRAVGYFGPNPIAIVGAGDVTFNLPVREPTSSTPSLLHGSDDRNYLVVRPLTLRNVMHIPEAGINIISWSQLKRTRGLDLHLDEEIDGTIVVQHKNQPLMRFVLRDGLYFLDQALENQDPSQAP